MIFGRSIWPVTTCNGTATPQKGCFLLNHTLHNTMEPFGVKATLMARAVATLLVVRAQRKKSLTKGGLIAAFCGGFFSVGTGLHGFNLLVFHQIGTSATKYKEDYKATMDGRTVLAATGSIPWGANQNASSVGRLAIYKTVLL
jgi:hypothetical protein